MQIIVLHGDDTVKSYDRLQKFTSEARRRSWKITDFSLQEIENNSLFGEECFYVLHDYKLITKKDLEKISKYEGNLIIYNNAKIPSVALKNLNANKTELFELPQLLWKFLDNMTVTSLHKLLETQAIEYIMAMIAWKLKQKYLKNPSINTAKMITELAELDVKSKTGKADLSLSLDLLLLKQLQ